MERKEKEGKKTIKEKRLEGLTPNVNKLWPVFVIMLKMGNQTWQYNLYLKCCI